MNSKNEFDPAQTDAVDTILLKEYCNFQVPDEEEYEDDDGLFRISPGDVAMEL